MIKLHTYDGIEIYLSPSAIAQITEAGPSSQWHGIRSYIKTFDGKIIECQESAKNVATLIEGKQE